MLLVAAAGAVLALAIVGIVLVLAGGSGDGVNYSNLKPGDCFRAPSGNFDSVEVVACDSRHDLEVFAVVVHPAAPGDAFPGMDELLRYANPICLKRFPEYAGVGFEQLDLIDKYITPRQAAWRDGARTLVCAVGPSDGQPTREPVRHGR